MSDVMVRFEVLVADYGNARALGGYGVSLKERTVLLDAIRDLAASHARLQAELERWMAVARDAQKDADRLSGLEKLTEEGDCPGIINDDNGHWAVTDDGMQNIPCGDEPADINTTFYVEAAKWKPTIREAIDDYLTAARASTQAEKGEDHV